MGSPFAFPKSLPRWVNPFYLVVLLLPLIFMFAMPSLRLPFHKCVFGAKMFDDQLPLGFGSTDVYETYGYYTQEAQPSLDSRIWALSHIDLSAGIPGSGGATTNDVSPEMTAFAQLAKAHPRSPFYLVAALKFLPSDGRVAGPWETSWDQSYITRGFARSGSSVLGFPQTSTPTPANVSGPLSAESVTKIADMPKPMTPAAIALGMDLAERGQKLEPDNTFFDWELASLLFAAHRDDEAVNALMMASHKTSYDIHTARLAAAGVSSFGSVQPLLTEEKWLIGCLAKSTLAFDQTHLTKMALWVALQKEDAGDEAGALRIEAALVKLNYIRLQRAPLLSDQYRPGRDMERVWDAPAFMRTAHAMQKPMRFRYSAQYVAANAAVFSHFARRQGRNDLAVQTAKQVPVLIEMWRRFDSSSGFWSVNFPSDREHILKIEVWCWMTVLATWQVLWSLGLWLLLAVIGPLRKPKGESLESSEAEALSGRVVFYPLALGSALSIVLAASGASHIIFRWTTFGDLDSGEFKVLGAVAIGAPLVLVQLSCLIATRWRLHGIPSGRVPRRQISHYEALSIPLLQRFRIRFWRIINFLWFRLLPLAVLFYLQFLILSLLGVKVPPHFWLDEWGEALLDRESMVNGFCATFALYIVGVLVYWRLESAPGHLATVHQGLRGTRRALAWIIPISLWLLLVTLVGGNVARGTLEEQIDAKMAQGISDLH